MKGIGKIPEGKGDGVKEESRKRWMGNERQNRRIWELTLNKLLSSCLALC